MHRRCAQCDRPLGQGVAEIRNFAIKLFEQFMQHEELLPDYVPVITAQLLVKDGGIGLQDIESLGD